MLVTFSTWSRCVCKLLAIMNYVAPYFRYIVFIFPFYLDYYIYGYIWFQLKNIQDIVM